MIPESVRPSLIADPDVASGYAVDSTPRATPPERYSVVRARHRQDVIDVLRHAAEHRIPVVAQGGRTGLVGAAVALENSIVLNVEKLNDIHIDPDEQIAVVGPGVLTADLKAAAAEHGLAYPPDPASAAWCTIGGNVATNAGGLCCVKYGVTADYVRGLEVVLPGGGVMRTGRRTAKGVTGMDLTGLFVGSEGTLGVVTEAVLKLVPAPAPPLTVMGVFDSLDDAMAAVGELRRLPHLPCLIELMDGPALRAIQEYRDFGFPTDAEAVLLVQADRADHTLPDAQRYAEVLIAAGAEVAVAEDQAESELLMAGRRAMNPAMEVKGPRLIEDMCVPVRSVAELIRMAHQVAADHGLEIVVAGHAGDGNLHPAIFFDPDDESQREAARSAFDTLVSHAWRLGGTLAGEHGVGELKAPWLAGELGEPEMARQRAIKALFDPLGIMNPGRVFPATDQQREG